MREGWPVVGGSQRISADVCATLTTGGAGVLRRGSPPHVWGEYVLRPRLIERLNEGLPRQTSDFARKLTLISAPAGFGKTTLLSE